MELFCHQVFIRILILLIGCIFLLWMLRSYYPSLSPPIYRNNCTKSLIESNNCTKSLIESNNYICESDVLWDERKTLYQIQDKENMMKRQGSKFFLSNWEPNFHCSHARRIGKMGDGGKWVCDVFRLKTRSDCLIYSAGSNGDFSFEIAMKISMPHCEIHTFDKKLYKCPDDTCIFHQTTFGDGTFPVDSKTWQMIIEELEHTNRVIDIFKIDIEGGEYKFFPSLFNSPEESFPRQILVELHPNNANGIHKFFELFRANNYVIFSKEVNLIAGPTYFEYAFLKLNSLFLE